MVPQVMHILHAPCHAPLPGLCPVASRIGIVRQWLNTHININDRQSDCTSVEDSGWQLHLEFASKAIADDLSMPGAPGL